jgi:hypothetical protein
MSEEEALARRAVDQHIAGSKAATAKLHRHEKESDADRFSRILVRLLLNTSEHYMECGGAKADDLSHLRKDTLNALSLAAKQGVGERAASVARDIARPLSESVAKLKQTAGCAKQLQQQEEQAARAWRSLRSLRKSEKGKKLWLQLEQGKYLDSIEQTANWSWKSALLFALATGVLAQQSGLTQSISTSPTTRALTKAAVTASAMAGKAFAAAARVGGQATKASVARTLKETKKIAHMAAKWAVRRTEPPKTEAEVRAEKAAERALGLSNASLAAMTGVVALSGALGGYMNKTGRSH